MVGARTFDRSSRPLVALAGHERQVAVAVIDDAFVYGYGLDVDHRYRNLPFVTSQGD